MTAQLQRNCQLEPFIIVLKIGELLKNVLQVASSFQSILKTLKGWACINDLTPIKM